MKSAQFKITLPFSNGSLRSEILGPSGFSLIPSACSLLFVFLLVSCKNSVVPAEPEPQAPDTTSQNWIFDPAFDIGSQGELFDAAIINDTLAYAVGLFYLNDSTGQLDSLPYNLVKWNGNSWQPQRVSVNHNDTLITPTLEKVFPFSPTQIWLVGGGLPIYGDGSNWTAHDVPHPGYYSKAWGNSPSSMYFVGGVGAFTYFNGTSWTDFGGAITLHLDDVWGDFNETTGKWEILATGGQEISGQRIILRLDNNTITSVSTSGVSGFLKSIWFLAGAKYYVGGGGLYERNNIDYCPSTPCWIENTEAFPSTKSIRGNAINDIMVAGSQSVAHFNGIRWRLFEMDAANRSVSILNNIVIIVGRSATYTATITMGRRY